MNISAPFITRPVGTALLTIAVALAGAVSYFMLPVSPLPQVDWPTIMVMANLPGASPETMASAVATPLERQFGRIAGITEMTSSSSLGSAQITLQFDLSRNIDAAGRDVQAAINAARGQLPTNLPGNPTYRKVNPADQPIMILALTSDTYTKAQMYDVASSILAQKLSQVQGVGQVNVGGGALPAVRVDVDPTVLNSMNLGLEDVRAVLASANANAPKGQIQTSYGTIAINATDQIKKAADYKPLLIAFRNGSPVRLSDVAEVTDSVQDVRNAGISAGKPAILLIISRQPNANIIDAVDRVKAWMPAFQAQIPAGIQLNVVMDRTVTIRSSVYDVEVTLLISILLVIMVVFLFLRNWRTTLIPSIVVPISLIGTFGVMYLLGYSIDNLSLMALAVATGFVVDDAIVVIENVTRYLEKGFTPVQAALRGAKEIGFTVFSISLSLIAVFIPILLMSDIVGRLFREFAVTLSVAIIVSMMISLTTTPMMCAALLRHQSNESHGVFFRASERFFNWIHGIYERTLGWVLRHPLFMLIVTFITIGVTGYLYVVIPKGFFPQQDTGRVMGSVVADQSTSFASIEKLLTQYATVVSQDPNVDTVVGFTGGGTSNTARFFVSLKPLGERKLNIDQVIAGLRGKLARIPGGTLFLQAAQDVRVGGRLGNAQYQYTLESDNLKDLDEWTPKLMMRFRTLPGIVDVNVDQQNNGLESALTIDRNTAYRLGISPNAIDQTLYDAFGQRQVSTLYEQLNQYHVVLEVQKRFWQSPEGLKYIYVEGSTGSKFGLMGAGTASPSSSTGALISAGATGSSGTGFGATVSNIVGASPGTIGTVSQVPLSAISHWENTTTSLVVNHQGQFPSSTISFNLQPGVSLGTAVTEINNAEREMGLPATIQGSFQGTAQAFQAAAAGQLLLITAAVLTVYIVLGILYESYIHPITILSTIPSAGVGALLALLVTGTELSVIALIGIILLIGIVKKNAIMMIDFALQAERDHGKSPRDAIFEACLLRFRPITMTTMAALLGGLPLALGGGNGAELRRPLGIAIVGGLIFSQMLTLYTTPVVYLYLDRLRLYFANFRADAFGPRRVLEVPQT
jgi:multidrug efflux pump